MLFRCLFLGLLADGLSSPLNSPPPSSAKPLLRSSYWSSFPAGWFGANLSGKQENATQLRELGRYKIAVLGWQHAIYASNFTNIAKAQIDQIDQIKRLYPEMPVYMYLAMDWAPPMWPEIKTVLEDSSTIHPGEKYYDWFLQATGQYYVPPYPEPGPLYTDIFCGGAGTKANVSNCRALYWNLHNQDARKYIAEKVVGAYAKLGSHDGIFFDACAFTLQLFQNYNVTNIPGNADQQKKIFWDGVSKLEAEVAGVLSQYNRRAMFSLGQTEVNFLRTEGSEDEAAMINILKEYPWIRYYEGLDGTDAFPALDNLLMEAQAGIPVVMHVYLKSLLDDITPHIAMFLIAREDGFYFMASTGWLDDDWKWFDEYDRDYGKPISKAKKTVTKEAVTYERLYTKSRISLSCSYPGSDVISGSKGCVGEIEFI